MTRDPSSEHDRDETSLERIDRNLSELNSEARVVITGVQVLFAFLLVIPFDSGFRTISRFERGVYFVTLILATLAAVCILAPSVRHRILFREHDKAYLLASANRTTLVGLGFLALAMCGSLLLVASTLFGAGGGAATAVLAAAVFGASWFWLPMDRRRRIERRRSSAASDPRSDRRARGGARAQQRPRGADLGGRGRAGP